MVEYTFQEYIEMLIIYGNLDIMVELHNACITNVFRIASLHHIPFCQNKQMLRETGTFKARRADCGAPRTRRTLDFEEEVLHQVEQNPSTSTRNFADAMNVLHMRVWRVLHDQHIHPYHGHKVHALGPADFAPLANFFNGFYTSLSTLPNILAAFFFH
ncbi:hypothetical protein ANN_04030 [Periplaneta americana]|uniref:Uncharacterized protein n=1 Tax=Periplaneta americana TaxID=6978 RepID=A0ABQ8T8W7_PERAM|nr:hypothetical protein ANN_04030 [Periplaneta americana]